MLWSMITAVMRTVLADIFEALSVATAVMESRPVRTAMYKKLVPTAVTVPNRVSIYKKMWWSRAMPAHVTIVVKVCCLAVMSAIATAITSLMVVLGKWWI